MNLLLRRSAALRHEPTLAFGSSLLQHMPDDCSGVGGGKHRVCGDCAWSLQVLEKLRSNQLVELICGKESL